MTYKIIRNTLGVILLLADSTKAGLINYETSSDAHPEHHNHHQHHHEVSIANSFMHFHGPVEGPEFEVKVPYIEPYHHLSHDHEHNHLHEHEPSYVMDYVAHPKYEYEYGVEDYHTGDFHSHKESRDGSSVSGEYSVAEPGGRLRTVSYRADKDGFHAVVHTTGKNDHSGGTYGYQQHHHDASVELQQPQHHHHHPIVEEQHEASEEHGHEQQQLLHGHASY